MVHEDTRDPVWESPSSQLMRLMSSNRSLAESSTFLARILSTRLSCTTTTTTNPQVTHFPDTFFKKQLHIENHKVWIQKNAMITDNKEKTFDLSFGIHNRMSVGRAPSSAPLPGITLSGKRRQNQGCKMLPSPATLEGNSALKASCLSEAKV